MDGRLVRCRMQIVQMPRAMKKQNYYLAGLVLHGILFNRPDYFAWIPGRKYIRRNILCYNTAGPDHSAIANRCTRANNGAAANPDIFTDCDWFRILKTGGPLFSIHGMSGCIYLNVWTEQCSVANFDKGYIKDNAIEIKVNAAPQFDVGAIVTIKGRCYVGIGDVCKKLCS